MKIFFSILFILASLQIQSQSFFLVINGTSNKEQKTIDSIGYQKKHDKVSSILDEIKTLDSLLYKLGHITHYITEQKKTNDSTFNYTYFLGNPIANNKIITTQTNQSSKEILSITKDTITISFSETEIWIKSQLQILEKKGYSQANIQLTNQKIHNSSLYSNLNIYLGSSRKTDEIIILGYEKFPKNIHHQLNKSVKNKTFNQELVKKINNNLNNLSFITQVKYPEILFTKDKTSIYAYVNKSKPNKFDGFIGFSNTDKNKLIFNGYLDLQLTNILNYGEKFKLFWKNNGEQQTQFDFKAEIPYLFKTPLGIKTELNIFKQDSTFQNTKIDTDIGYHFSFSQKIFLGYQKTTSIDIQNNNTQNLKNFTNQFYTISYEYLKNNFYHYLLPEKTSLLLKLGYGSRKDNQNKNNQFFTQLEINHLFEINLKNQILIKNHSFYLSSKDYLTNELYRFGGINSIRGFRENSLQANLTTGLFTEYRYNLANNLIIHSILDYAYMEDKTISKTNKLLGIGLGFELLSENGLFHFIYSNGSANSENIKLSNSIIQISFKTNF